MRIRSPRDFWAGLVFIAIAALFAYFATGYRYGTAQRMGPGFYPLWVAGFLAILGVVITARSFVLKGPPIDAIGWRPLGVTLAAIAIFGVALTYLGLAAAIVALVVVCAFADPTSRPLEVIALAIFLAVFSVVVFVKLLGLPLQVWSDGLMEMLR